MGARPNSNPCCTATMTASVSVMSMKLEMLKLQMQMLQDMRKSMSEMRTAAAAILGAAAGAIFTLRLPGHYVDIPVAAGLGFAMTTLGTRLAVVLAHEDCRAVDAAFTELTTGVPPNLALAPLTGSLAAGLYRAGGAASVQEAIDVNARVTAQNLITQCASLRQSIIDGDAQLAVMRYSPATRRITVLEESVVPHAGAV